MTASIPLAWLGTYLIHSTLLLGTVWVLSRLLRRTPSGASLALEEALWKAALVGGILTASLQVGVGMALPAAPAASTVASGDQAPSLTSQTLPGQTPTSDALPASTAAAAALSLPVTPHPLLTTPAALLPGWQRLALAVWLLGSLVGTAWLAGAWMRLRRMLRCRAEIGDGPARRLLDRLVTTSPSRRPVRLTGSGRLPVPVALGVLEREICVPQRALTALGPRRQEGLLAHELAHLERRDPAWLLTARTIESLLFVQPLNRVARRHLQETAEYRCDAWAVEQTGDRAGLARCLTEVAAWLTGGDAAPAWGTPAWSESPGMASSTKNLGRRVRQILAGEAPRAPETHRKNRRWSLALPAVLLVAVAGFAPGVTPTLPDAPAAEAAPAPAPAAGEPGTPSASAQPDRGDQPAGDVGPDDGMPASGDEVGTVDEQDLDAPGDLDDVAEPALDVERDAELERSIEAIRQKTAALAATARPDPAELAELHEELARVVELSMATQQESLQELRERLTEALDAEELTPEKREQLRAEIERIGTETRSLADRMRPSTEELDRLRAEALRMSRESMPSHDEIERMNREVERMSRDVERLNRQELRQLDERASRGAAQVETRAAREHRQQEATERRAEDLEKRRATLDQRRQELEQRMHTLEVRRQQLEERFEAEQAAQEKALEERKRGLDVQRQALEERHRELLRETEERDRQAVEQKETAARPEKTEGNEPPPL